MTKAVDKILTGAGTIIHSLVIPLFFLIFTMYYKPAGAYDLLEMAHVSYAFNVTMLFCIILVSLSITRGWLYLLGKYRNFTETLYFIWCLTETLIASLFGSVYVNVLAITIYPYAFLFLGFELYQRDREQANQPDDNSLIRFYDEYKKLRLVIAPEAIMFIRSEDNYVQIHYNDRNKAKKFILRSSMRALEEDLSRHGLVRCHRSYFINPLYIKIVHRDETGLIVAKLKQEGFESIPISRKYQNEITRLL